MSLVSFKSLYHGCSKIASSIIFPHSNSQKTAVLSPPHGEKPAWTHADDVLSSLYLENFQGGILLTSFLVFTVVVDSASTELSSDHYISSGTLIYRDFFKEFGINYHLRAAMQMTYDDILNFVPLQSLTLLQLLYYIWTEMGGCVRNSCIISCLILIHLMSFITPANSLCQRFTRLFVCLTLLLEFVSTGLLWRKEQDIPLHTV